jgi:glycosyltransferase involved in cell wall biosynthesis
MKIVTVHRGARDGYQVARALQEGGLLEALVTDLYWSGDRGWAKALERIMPHRLSRMLHSRCAENVPSGSVKQCAVSGLISMVASKTRRLSFRLERAAVRWCDRTLGKRAGQLATQKNAALMSYSYYAHSAFSHYRGDQPRILFQLHPHPASVRAILHRERELHPECASSLDREWELALPEEDFRKLVDEVAMAEYWLVASQFTKQTLIEAGISAARIGVVPYGIDSTRYSARKPARQKGSPLHLLFVGTLCQRKGIKYLIEALELLPAGSVRLTMCGRPVDDLSLLRNSRVPIDLRPSVSAEGLLEAYKAADIFVSPSLAEGFAHVLLEAMASGLPVISTTSTAAPDLIRHGEEGYIIEPGNAADLAAHIEKFLRNPEKVETMSAASQRRAEYFTWSRFRAGVAAFAGDVLDRGAEASSSRNPPQVTTEPCLYR